MPTIHLQTHIHAPIAVVFDAARSIDLHLQSLGHTGERVVAGRSSGLIQLGETVTWEARHFGVLQQMEVRITEMTPPHSFTDEMVRGAFRAYRHVHWFEQMEDGTVMKDVIYFQSPAGVLGRVFNFLVLTRYMRRLIVARNGAIRAACEAAGS